MENQSLKSQYKKRTEKQSKQAKTIKTGRVPGAAAAAAAAAATTLLAGTKAADPSEGGRCGAVWRASGLGPPASSTTPRPARPWPRLCPRPAPASLSSGRGGAATGRPRVAPGGGRPTPPGRPTGSRPTGGIRPGMSRRGGGPRIPEERQVARVESQKMRGTLLMLSFPAGPSQSSPERPTGGGRGRTGAIINPWNVGSLGSLLPPKAAFCNPLATPEHHHGRKLRRVKDLLQVTEYILVKKAKATAVGKGREVRVSKPASPSSPPQAPHQVKLKEASKGPGEARKTTP